MADHSTYLLPADKGSAGVLFENQIVSEWMTTKEAATYLGISPNAVRILVVGGE